MKVSVVVPAFNQSAYLREALASALAQTHADLEVVVVDDGSTDDTRAVCESFGDPRIRYVHQPNDRTRGIGARNHAMLLATGEWIALLDQDDRWAPDKLARQLQRAAEVPECGAVFCRVRFIDEHGGTLRTQDEALPEGDVFHALLRRNRYFAASGIFRRALIPVIGLPGESAGLADWHLWLAIARHRPVAVVPEVLADYREHSQGYQLSLLAGNRLRFAHDQWKTVHAQRARLHDDCPACRAAYAGAAREVAQLYLRAARAGLATGRWRGSGTALRMAAASAPLWVARPWVLAPQALALSAAALAGGWRSITARA